MQLESDAIVPEVRERQYAFDHVPGLVWTPATADARGLILIAHGGGQHKRAPGVVARAQRLVRDGGFVVAALDAPGSGERPRGERDERAIAEIRAGARPGSRPAS